MAHGGPYNLAIETSGHVGSVALGRADELLDAMSLPATRRHNVELTATIDRLMTIHGADRRDLGEVYVSIGPGSFTGLRVAVATAKILALALGARLVAVPTLDVTAANVPAPADQRCLAVALNLKRRSAYTGLYAWDRTRQRWRAAAEPCLLTPEQLLERSPRPLAVLVPRDPGWADLERMAAGSDVVALDTAMLTADARVVWRLGRELARDGRFVDPAILTPLYVRPPEAVELWSQRKAAAVGAS